MGEVGSSGELRGSEPGWRQILARLPVIVCELAANGVTLFVNDAVQRVTGYGPGELMGQPFWDVLYRGEPPREEI